jgi:hypothetical protein
MRRRKRSASAGSDTPRRLFMVAFNVWPRWAQRAMFLLPLHGHRHQVQNQAHACRALMFIVRIFVNDTITIAVWQVLTRSSLQSG